LQSKKDSYDNLIATTRALERIAMQPHMIAKFSKKNKHLEKIFTESKP